MLGDEWSLGDLRLVMLSGVALALAPMSLLCMFRDEHALGAEAETHVGDGSDTAQVPPTQALLALDSSTSRVDVARPPPGSAARATQLHTGHNRIDARQRYWVPRITTASDILFGLASGMTIKYFPLFFKDETGLSPIKVNSIFCITPFLIAINSLMVRKAASRLGIVPVVLTVKVAGIALLLTMAGMGQVHHDPDNDNKPALWTNGRVIVPIFIVRTVLMNSTVALQKTILMNHVEKSRRGIWNALDAVTQFGWSGSALLGGWITDHHGYGATFFVTAGMQSVALGIFGMLLSSFRAECAVAARTLNKTVTKMTAWMPKSRSRQTTVHSTTRLKPCRRRRWSAESKWRAKARSSSYTKIVQYNITTHIARETKHSLTLPSQELASSDSPFRPPPPPPSRMRVRARRAQNCVPPVPAMIHVFSVVRAAGGL